MAGTIKAFLRKRLRFFDLRYMRPAFACGCVEGSAFPAAEISLRQDRGDLARDLAGFRGEMNVVAHGLLLRGEAPRGGSAVDVAGKGRPPAERKRCESLRPRLKGGAGDTHNGFRSTAVPLSGGFRPAGQTACPAFDGYLPEGSSNRRNGVAVDVGLLNDGEQETENRRIRRRFTRVSVANVEGSARAPERLPRNGESARVCGGV